MNNLINIQLSQCPNIGQAETAISELLRRAPASIGGLFMLVTWQSLLLSFYGGLLSGSPRACRYLRSGYCRPDSDPRPSTAIESGIKETILGAYYDAIKTHSINGIYSRLSTSLHRPGNSLKAFRFLRGADMFKNDLILALELSRKANLNIQELESIESLALKLDSFISALATAETVLEDFADSPTSECLYGDEYLESIYNEASKLTALRNQITQLRTLLIAQLSNSTEACHA